MNILDLLLGRVIANKLRIRFSFIKPIVAKAEDFYRNYVSACDKALDDFSIVRIIILTLCPITSFVWLITPKDFASTWITLVIAFIAYRIVNYK